MSMVSVNRNSTVIFAVMVLIILLSLFSCQPPHEPTPASDIALESEKPVKRFVRDLSEDGEWLRSLSQSMAVDLDEKKLYDALFEDCAEEQLASLYEENEYQAVILQEDRDHSEAALQILQSIPSHALKYSPRHLEEIQKLMQERELAAKTPQAAIKMEAKDIEHLTNALEEEGFDLDQASPKKALKKLLHGPDCAKYWPRYCEERVAQKRAVKSELKGDVRLDVLLSCDLLGMADALRLAHAKNSYRFDPWKHLLDPKTIQRIRKRLFFRELINSGPRLAFARIQPPSAEYEKLRKSRAIYIDAQAAGGWHAVKAPSRLPEHKLGQSYPYISDIRKRLAQEGYPIQELDSQVYDEPLRDAVALYRELHQLSPKKFIDSTLIRNMAVSPEDRLASIDLTLERYRRSPVGELDYFLLVNVPDFHAELWRNGQRLHRFRVVVGNNQMQRDPETKKPVRDPETKEIIYPNRTPLMSAKLNEIIYNPYWNVPARIRIEELEPKLAENPNYYIENNFEEVNVDNPRLYYVRELPNPRNSLGRVKFMFPNPHDVYLHDTPAKSLFKNPTRAYSHGCVRVQDPMDLAELLLKEDGSWNEREVQKVLNTEPLEQTSFFLKRPVDVVIEYFDTRVSDEGPVAFLSDVYGYDAEGL